MKLALNGQWKDISGLIYTYPEKLSGLPDWLASVFDPRHARGLFKTSYCYAVWYNNNGYYYGCIKTNTDSRNGCVMLTLFAEKKVPLHGVVLAEKMRSLLDYCLSKNDPSEIAFVDVSLKATEIEELLTPRELPQDVTVPTAIDKKTAYRLYDNDAELGLFLENPNQNPYAEYKCVLAIEAASFNGDALAAQPLAQITDPIRKTYDIRSDSSDVVPSRWSVVEGEWFDITYKKAGFVNETVRAVAGKANAYCFIEGNVINIRSAEAVGINFKTEVILKVVDEETKSVIRKWTCKIDGKPQLDVVKLDEEGFGHLKLDPSKPHKVLVSAEGYQSREFDIAVSERGYKTAPLHSLDESVCVSLEMDKETVTGSVRMKSNNSLYHPLKDVERNGGTLQVKRPFFSRRNLVPIVVFALVALLLGGVFGRFVLGGKNQEKPIVATDSIIQQKLDTLTKQLEKASDEKKALELRLTIYGKTLVTIKEKGDNKAVIDTLGLEKYKVVLEGKADEAQLNSLIESLNQISQSNQQSYNNVGGNTGGGPINPKPVVDTLDQHLKRDVWDLKYLENSKEKKYRNLAKYFREGDVNNLYQYSSLDNINAKWKDLRENISKMDQEQKDGFSRYILRNISNNNDKVNLTELFGYFDD